MTTPETRLSDEAPVYEALAGIINKVTLPSSGINNEEVIQAAVQEMNRVRTELPGEYSVLIDALFRIRDGEEPPIPGKTLTESQRRLLVAAIDEHTSETTDASLDGAK